MHLRSVKGFYLYIKLLAFKITVVDINNFTGKEKSYS
jgi:hypothetical protein